MKHFNLRFKLLEGIFLKYQVLVMAVFGVIIPLDGIAQGINNNLTKEVDFSSEVTRVTQKYEYWCVYACWESLNTSLPQCTHCFNFLHRFYMNGESNPYQFVSDKDFKDAIERLKADADETCNFSGIYEKFGVSGESFEAYFNSENIYEISMVDFSKKITEENESNPSITFLVTNEDSHTRHCVVFMGSQLYNNNWFDPKSVIRIMNPAFSSIRDITYYELTTMYGTIYSKR